MAFKTFRLAVAALVLAVFITACQSERISRSLSPETGEFYSSDVLSSTRSGHSEEERKLQADFDAFCTEALRMFVELVGVSKANSSVDYAMLEYCIREDLKLKRPRMMAVLDPVKLIIDNYPEGQTEMLSIPNNLENPEMGEREVPFSRELYIEREDFMENPPKKYFRLFPGNEVRLMGAYFVTCTGFEKDENGNVTEIHCTYDPETKSGSGFTGRKVKGTIHWVSAPTAGKVECRLYENIVDEEKGKLNADGTLNLNPNSKTITTAYVEPKLMEAKAYDSFQFMRNGYYCVDCKDSKEGQPVYNRIVSLKSSFKLPK